jgi:hypothetical protein
MSKMLQRAEESGTANFDVHYDNSLGANGQYLADAALANCEADLYALRGWFGGADPGNLNVYTDPGTNTVGIDRDYVSTGRATLFLNRLHYQLHSSLARIVQVRGATLQHAYQHLTNSADAFGSFAALLRRNFPAGIHGQPARTTSRSRSWTGRLGRLGVARRGREL